MILAPATIIPVHQEGWAHFTSSAADLERAFAVAGVADHLYSLAPGERVELPSLGARVRLVRLAGSSSSSSPPPWALRCSRSRLASMRERRSLAVVSSGGGAGVSGAGAISAVSRSPSTSSGAVVGSAAACGASGARPRGLLGRALRQRGPAGSRRTSRRHPARLGGASASAPRAPAPPRVRPPAPLRPAARPRAPPRRPVSGSGNRLGLGLGDRRLRRRRLPARLRAGLGHGPPRRRPGSPSSGGASRSTPHSLVLLGLDLVPRHRRRRARHAAARTTPAPLPAPRLHPLPLPGTTPTSARRRVYSAPETEELPAPGWRRTPDRGAASGRHRSGRHPGAAESRGGDQDEPIRDHAHDRARGGRGAPHARSSSASRRPSPKASGVWGSVEPWGKRKLAYEIDHMAEAWYYVLTFDPSRRAARDHPRARDHRRCDARTWPSTAAARAAAPPSPPSPGRGEATA